MRPAKLDDQQGRALETRPALLVSSSGQSVHLYDAGIILLVIKFDYRSLHFYDIDKKTAHFFSCLFRLFSRETMFHFYG